MATKMATKKTENNFWMQFQGDEYKPENQSIPWIQVINKEDPRSSGLFLTADNAESVGFTPDESWKPHQTRFRSGGTSDGFISQAPSLLVIRRSPLLVFDREDKRYIGLFRKEAYNPSQEMVKVRYLVFLVGKDNKPLHNTPLQLTTKGYFSVSFGDAYSAFTTKFDSVIGGRYGQRFHCQCLFTIRISPELKGTGSESSWTCIVESFNEPTTENVRDLFVGGDPQIKKMIEKEYEDSDGFWDIKSEEAPKTESYEDNQIWQIFISKLDQAVDQDQVDAIVNWICTQRQWVQVESLPNIAAEVNKKDKEARDRLAQLAVKATAPPSFEDVPF